MDSDTTTQCYLTSELTCLSLNVRGLNDQVKRRTVFRWLHQQRVDVVFLQETFSNAKIERVWRAEWGGTILYSHGTNHSKGVAILVNPRKSCEIINCKNDTNGRLLIVNAVIAGEQVCFVNLYAPNEITEQYMFFQDIRTKLRENSTCHTIMAGDFNCSLTDMDKRGGRPVKEKLRTIQAINLLTKGQDLIDIWREKNPKERRYTWRDANQGIMCRLDYIFVSDSLKARCGSANIIHAPSPDHSAVTVHFEPQNACKRGPGFWRFNNTLLNDKTYTDTMKLKIDDARAKYSEIEDKRLLWDLIKMEIRSFTMYYSKMKAKERKKDELSAEKQTNSYIQQYESNPSQENWCKYNRAKEKLDEIRHLKVKGSIIRSRCRWHEEGEKSTKYFLNLEKRNYEQKCINELLTENNSVITDPGKILEQGKQFFESLYTSKETNPHDPKFEEFFTNNEINKLTGEQRDNCEGNITVKEALTALKQMAKKKNRSPGTDGLSFEFLLYFWDKIKNEIVDSFNTALEEGELAISQKRGIIRLLPKQGDCRKLENWRPIALLNTDYKILTKCLALRLEPVLPSIIHENQTGYVKGRYIGTNIRRMWDIIQETERTQTPGIALFVDFRKAFDTLEWNYLEKALMTFEFGPIFRRWVSVLYKNSCSCVINNGFTSDWFTLKRGVRQGDPLSGLLFILGLELLACKLRSDTSIVGITINNQITNNLMYADDTTIFANSVTSARRALATIETFGQFSGLQASKKKTEAMWIGGYKERKDKPLDVHWPDKPIKCLGVHFSYDKAKCEELDFNEKLTKMDNILKVWSGRNLTLIGRILIYKCLAVSKLIYNCSVLTTPPNFERKVNAIGLNFVWNHKPHKVKFSTLIAEKDKGGLKMMDFASMVKALRASWVGRICTTQALESHFLQYGGAFLFKCNFSIKTLKLGNMPTFYIKILEAWEELNSHRPQTSMEIKQEFLWNNQYILQERKSVFWKEMYICGIRTIQNIIDDGGNILTPKAITREFGFEFNASDILRYYGLCSSIPPGWKKVLTDPINSKPDVRSTLSYKCKQLYQLFVNKIVQPPSKQDEITRCLQDEEDIKKVYMLPYICSQETKMQYFQYRIIHSFLTTNAYLKKIRIKDSDQCPYCEEKQTIVHLFAECHTVKTFWKDFTDWWKKENQHPVGLTNIEIIYGHLSHIENNKTLNRCILQAKYYLFCTALSNAYPTFHAVKHRLLEYA